MNDAERFWAKVEKTEGCWNWTAGLKTSGYGRFSLNGKVVYSHRLSYILHHPLTINLFEGHPEICVCHKCDNRKCVNPTHLFLGSQVDNMKDMYAKGRCADTKGEKCSASKLTEIQVREIRKKNANGGISHQQLALEYGISTRTIYDIINRKSWSHI